MSDPTGVIQRDPEILGGTPVFAGTRVPFESLIEYLAGGDSLDEFLRQFPSVRREQALRARSSRVADLVPALPALLAALPAAVAGTVTHARGA